MRYIMSWLNQRDKILKAMLLNMNIQKLKWIRSTFMLVLLFSMQLCITGCSDDDSTNKDQYTFGELEVAANGRSMGYSTDGIPVAYYKVRENGSDEWHFSQIEGFDSVYQDDTEYHIEVKIINYQGLADIPDKIYVFQNIISAKTSTRKTSEPGL